MDDAIFKLPTPLLRDKVVTGLDEVYNIMNLSLIHILFIKKFMKFAKKKI